LQTRDLLFLQFINELLEYDPERRLTPVNALRHPFLSALFPFDLFERSLAVEAVDMNEILMDAAADSPMRLNRQPLDAANENPITAPEIEDITRPTSAISSITLATLPDSNPGTAANRSTIFPSAQSSFQPCKRHSNEFNSLINYQSTKLVVESDMMDFIETSPEITMHSVAAQTDFHGEEFAQAIIKLKEHPATAATTPASNEPREKSEPHQSPPVSSSSDHVNNQSNEDDVLTDTAEEKENSVAENSSISTSSARSINTLDSAKSVTTNRTSVFNHVDSMEAVAAADLSSPIPTVRSSKKRKLLLLQQQQEQKQQRQSQTEIRTTPSSPRISELLRLNSSFSSSANSAFVVPSKSRRASGSQNVNSRQSTRLERPTIIVMGRTRRQAAAIKQKTNQPTDIVLDRDLLRTKRSMSPSEFL
jgi:hypothetical protein